MTDAKTKGTVWEDIFKAAEELGIDRSVYRQWKYRGVPYKWITKISDTSGVGIPTLFRLKDKSTWK